MSASSPARLPRISQRSPQACQGYLPGLASTYPADVINFDLPDRPRGRAADVGWIAHPTSYADQLAPAECTRRKVRCDKQVPCSRCSRLRKPCSRELVYTTKALGRSGSHADERHFLDQLSQLLDAGTSLADVSRAVKSRVASIRDHPVATQTQTQRQTQTWPSTPTPTPTPTTTATTGSVEPVAGADATSIDALRTLQSQVWCRQSNFCYPHRRGCQCQLYRSYSELASLNSDLGSPQLRWTYLEPDASLFLAAHAARRVVDFHVRHLWWHHNALHSPTFLDQCDRFWASGTVVHPLWLALYLSILASTLWTLANSPRHAEDLGIDVEPGLVERQYQEMMRILYAEHYLENPSMFTIQAAIIATRFAHNIGFSSAATNLLNSVIGLAQSIGLHRIASPQHGPDLSTPTQSRVLWHESIEVETGRRTWWQLVIQDHFSIPFTESHLISPSQYSTALPLNCNDNDLMPEDDDVITTSSYTRCIAQEAVLMPRLLDCFVRPPSQHPALQYHYLRVLHLDQDMRSTISQFPSSLLTEKPLSEPSQLPAAPWLPTARRTLSISAADKIIMLHRPLMFKALRTPELPKTRTICLSAAVTILREHERDATEEHETLAIWTQTAFCTSAVTVLGLELLYGPTRNSPHTGEYRQLLSATAHRLQKRRIDSMALRCVHLIDVFLAADAEAAGLSSDSRRSVQRKHTEFVDELVQSQRIVSNFLSSSLMGQFQSTGWGLVGGSGGSANGAAALPEDTSSFTRLDADDFESWYNGLFAPGDS